MILSNSGCNLSGEQILRAQWVRVRIKLSLLGREGVPTEVLASKGGFPVNSGKEFRLGLSN